MKKIKLLFSLLVILLILGKAGAQQLVCNDLVYVSLDQNCTHTLLPIEMLEGGWVDNLVVEVDKTLPYGNGPWLPPDLGASDVNKTYQARVRHLPSGNMCWGNVKIEDKLPPVLQCQLVSTIALDNLGNATISPTDLSVTVADGCTPPPINSLTFAGNQTSLTFDCSDVGVNIVTLAASDASGNTATCQHAVLVSNSDVCLNCVSACPESVTVSFDEGYQNLLPAFQTNQWEAFEPYGNGLFDHQNCTLLDSFYIIDYQTSTAGYNWFVRSWAWVNGSGELSFCKQSVLFPTTETVTVQGLIFLDSVANCSADASEQGVSIFPIQVIKLPSGTATMVQPGSDGTYSLTIDFNIQDTAALVQLVLPIGVATVCPNDLLIDVDDMNSTYTFNVGLQSQGECPFMLVDMAFASFSRCQTNSLVVKYCNVGLDTAYGAFVTVHLDSLLTLQTASLPYTSAPGNNFTFQVGSVPPFECSTLNISALIDCDVVLGQTLCNEATGYPNTPCGEGWSGPVVYATAHCDDDSVKLAIWNQGQQDMTEVLDFIVIEDFIMYRAGSFQLPAGDSITITVPANGATWRIEADQVENFPSANIVTAVIEGCGGINTPGLVNAFSQNDPEVFYDQECVQVTGSFDPNDKTAVPTGYGPDHYIRPNEPLEYMIRFQNTGTATAFRVVVIDTISSLLNIYSLELGASSHPYRAKVYPGGILQFEFDPIALPDSNANEAASHGFVQFRIAQQPDLPEGTVITNTASIYFDQNDPVVTNTAFHTIHFPFVSLDSWTPVVPDVHVNLMPNPFREQAMLVVDGKTLSQGKVMLYDAHGRLVQSQNIADNKALLKRGNLTPGVYFFQLMERGVGIGSGKIVVE